ncbi:hypothetical protein [Paracoccus spongiarum]|uniref:ATP-binding protein n=1 Tax=Paracoccus spongiarum TaxID=3064387 RepID=A0ABT9JAG9_9RHOB|nr:hypothetical protein [Paracoccus sp. 2205BS29-5]MDP5306664.1 hypothetical protein [Paracoccus sp. 2205BS29-5]
MQFHLDETERRVLFSELLSATEGFDTPAILKHLLRDYPVLVAQLPAGALPNGIHIDNAIDLCSRSGYDLSPPALLALLDYLVHSGRLDADTLLRARLLTVPRGAIAVHPLEAELLFERLPFANRAHLRQILREMSGEASLKKILHIEGTPGSGRSWTAQLIDFHCTSAPGLLYCQETVTEDNGSATGPVELARNLAIKLGADLSDCPPPMTNEDAHLSVLVQWIIAEANRPQPDLQNNRRRVWFVFDGFKTGTLREDTARFLVELARQCTSGVAAQLHRVVFCEFDFDLASRIRLKVQNYRIEPVTADDLRGIVRRVIEANEQIPEADRAAVIEQSMRMVTQDAPGPFVDLSEIGARLQQMIEEARR